MKQEIKKILVKEVKKMRMKMKKVLKPICLNLEMKNLKLEKLKNKNIFEYIKIIIFYKLLIK